MKWFLFFVVLISLHTYAYGKKIKMWVNVNDTVDLIVDTTYNIYSCEVKQYSTNEVIDQFRKKYELISQGNWELERKDNDTTYYFELLDYYKSCSFSISPFQRFFYGRWIVNTTTFHPREKKQDQYKYVFQEFFFPIPPTGRFENSTSDPGSKNDKKDIDCVNDNPLSLRPNKVLGQVKKCSAIHYSGLVMEEHLVIPADNVQQNKSYQIYPNTDYGVMFTGNNRTCQFKIFQMKSDYLFNKNKYYSWYDKWEIITDYEDHQLENKTSTQKFNIHMIEKFDSHFREQYVPRLPIKQRSMYLQLKLANYFENSTIPKFQCQFDAKDRQTEKFQIKIPEYNDSLSLQDGFYRRIDYTFLTNIFISHLPYREAYGYFFNFKYHGYYDCILDRENGTHEIYNFEKENTESFEYPIKLFDPLPNENDFRHYYNIRVVEGSLFPHWLRSNVPRKILAKKLKVIIEMPNGNSVGTFYRMMPATLSILERLSNKEDTDSENMNNYLYKIVSIIDNGIWTLHYHNMSATGFGYPVFTSFYSITTWDSTHVKVIVDMTTKSSSISMYNIQKNPRKCLFMSTERTVIAESKPKVESIKEQEISLTPINEIDSLSECKFKIHHSLKNNYGMKKLSIDYGHFTINRTIFLRNNFHAIKKYNKISRMHEKNSQFVKNNDEFLVNCSDNRPLLFCRIQAPTLEVTHITDKDKLEAGNCSMLIKNANILEHNGTWKCQLAFNESNIGSTIIEYFFSVQVRNFYVRSRIEYINETDERINGTIIKRVVFHCEISNYLKTYDNYLIEGHQIDYCLWNHANGSIISKNSNEYTVNITTPFSCDLTIHNLHEKDIGNWTCSPQLKLLTNLNLHDTFHLVKLPKMIILKNYTITPELISKITTYNSKRHTGSTGPGLDCHISPAVEAHMISCKWTIIYGDNSNFTADDPDGGHYFPQKKNSVCELRFLEWVKFGDKSDYGKWRCCVDIVDSVEPTICQDIELPNEVHPAKEGIGMYIFISIVIICVLALIGSCFYFIIKKLKEKLEKKRKEKQRQSRRSRSSRRRRRARSASHQSRARSSNRQNQARSSSHPRQQTSSLPSSQQDAQASRIISARIQAEPNIYV